MAGIKCMMSVLQVHNEADSSDIVLRDQIANVVFILLPKLTLTLINVAIGDMTQGQALISVNIFYIYVYPHSKGLINLFYF